MASRMLAKASSRDAPWEQQPGRVSHHTAHPSSDCTKVTGYFIDRGYYSAWIGQAARSCVRKHRPAEPYRDPADIAPR